ncbi:metal-dependent transcriptional regulator [Desulfobulbus elongatus]|uniref:metal-dependent transcriptional regulator n=1 Tax=Desulfobulbus elongatus TaxID=53332 RepID=UPI0006856CBE|nr:metal-dependent transcriptional regulator [Desulfobulbus elongatus]
MTARRNLSSSLEDYLETIYLIVREQGTARSKDVIRRLSVSAASVTEALRALDSRGLVNYVPYSLITLTPAGEARAREILHRHETLRDFFVEVLGVDPRTADIGACRIEHVISDEILDSMITYTTTVREAGQVALTGQATDTGDWPPAPETPADPAELSMKQPCGADDDPRQRPDPSMEKNS